MTLRRKNDAGGVMILGLKLYHRVIVINIAYISIKIDKKTME